MLIVLYSILIRYSQIFGSVVMHVRINRFELHHEQACRRGNKLKIVLALFEQLTKMSNALLRTVKVLESSSSD